MRWRRRFNDGDDVMEMVLAMTMVRTRPGGNGDDAMAMVRARQWREMMRWR